MESFSGNGWLILGLTLVIGWLLGLLSRSGGRKWKIALDQERAAHAALRKDHELLLKQQKTVVVTDPHPVKTGAF